MLYNAFTKHIKLWNFQKDPDLETKASIKKLYFISLQKCPKKIVSPLVPLISSLSFQSTTHSSLGIASTIPDKCLEPFCECFTRIWTRSMRELAMISTMSWGKTKLSRIFFGSNLRREIISDKNLSSMILSMVDTKQFTSARSASRSISSLKSTTWPSCRSPTRMKSQLYPSALKPFLLHRLWKGRMLCTARDVERIRWLWSICRSMKPIRFW